MTAGPPLPAPPNPSSTEPSRRPRRSRPLIIKYETAGILIIGVLILVFTLLRYWHHIPWGAR